MVFLAKVKEKISPHNNVSIKGHEPMIGKMRQDCAEAGQQLFVKNPKPLDNASHRGVECAGKRIYFSLDIPAGITYYHNQLVRININ